MVSSVRPLCFGGRFGCVVAVHVITANQAVALVATPQNVLGVAPLWRVVATVPSDQLGRLFERCHLIPEGVFAMFEGVAILVVRNCRPAQEKLRRDGKARCVKVWAHKEACKEAIHSRSIPPPSFDNRHQPIRFPEITAFPKANEHVARELSGNGLVRADVKTVVVLAWEKLNRQSREHESNLRARWPPVAHSDKFTIDTRWVYEVAADESANVVPGDWSTADDDVGDCNAYIGNSFAPFEKLQLGHDLQTLSAEWWPPFETGIM